MSNDLAIAAVTKTLRYLIKNSFGDLLDESHVTAMPPDKVDDSAIGDGLVNLFLYHVTYDAALANMAMQDNRLKPNEAGFPPIPLVLHYLVTAYSKTKDPEFTSDKLLGKAMSVLHDHPILSAAEIQSALKDSELHEQIERVRITREIMTVDEMSKLWMMFQTNYRLSAGYQVSVVLMESTRAPKTPLPVLQRGEADKGVASQSDLSPPYPAITEIMLTKETDLPKENEKRKQPAMRLGESVTIEGFHLDGKKVTARFEHPRLSDPLEVEVIKPTETKAEITLPLIPAKWPAGIYTVSLLIVPKDNKPDQQVRTTNELPMALAPVITPAQLPLNVARAADKSAAIVLNCSPEVLPDQRVSLLLSDNDARQVAANAHTTQTDQLNFIVKDAPLSDASGFFIRLRVDGVDSLLVSDYSAAVLKFDAKQKVIIHD